MPNRRCPPTFLLLSSLCWQRGAVAAPYRSVGGRGRLGATLLPCLLRGVRVTQTRLYVIPNLADSQPRAGLLG